jgi:hypothetical protein
MIGADFAADVGAFVGRQDRRPQMFAGRLGLGRAGAVAKEFQLAVVPAELRLILDAVANDAK